MATVVISIYEPRSYKKFVPYRYCRSQQQKLKFHSYSRKSKQNRHYQPQKKKQYLFRISYSVKLNKREHKITETVTKKQCILYKRDKLT